MPFLLSNQQCQGHWKHWPQPEHHSLTGFTGSSSRTRYRGKGRCAFDPVSNRFTLFRPSDRRTETYAGCIHGTDRRTDGRQTVTLCFPLDAASLTINRDCPFGHRISFTHLSPRYLKKPRDVILTPDSRTKTDVKKKLNIFSANCSSCASHSHNLYHDQSIKLLLTRLYSDRISTTISLIFCDNCCNKSNSYL